MKTDLKIVGGAYSARSIAVDMQECFNFYPEINNLSSKYPVSLIGTPGLKAFFTDSTNELILDIINGTASYSVSYPTRCMHVTSDNRLFRVSKNKLQEIDKGGNIFDVYTIASSTGFCSMADNGRQLILVDGDAGYIYNLKTWTGTISGTHAANTVEVIASVTYGGTTYNGFPGGSFVFFIDQYFVCNKPNTMQFYWCTLDTTAGGDGTLWDPLNYASAEGSPDNLTAMAKTNNELWMFGNKSTEVWYSSGDSDLPFQRIKNAFIDVGTIAPASVVTNGNDVFWLGSNAQGQGIILHANGYQPNRISNPSIEYIVSKIDKISDAEAYCYQQEGHYFYVITYPSGEQTWAYDLSTGEWHRRAYWDATNGVFKRHRGQKCVAFDGKILISDYENGNVYEYDLSTYTDNGDTIRRVRTFPHIHNLHRRVYYNSLELDVERGVGLTNGDTPYYVLTYSNDGGFTWGNEIWASIGNLGEYYTRVKWQSLGSGTDRVFRVVITSPVKSIILGATADISV